MNRHERRKVIRSLHEAADLNGKSLMEMLRDARPTLGFRTKPTAISPDGMTYDVSEFEMSDYSWIDAVIEEGFDPNGPLGPTYWRIAKTVKSHYYSTFIGPDGAFRLLITEIGSPLFRATS